MANQAPPPAERRDEPAPAILIVDDNADKRLALTTMLAPLGHELVEADSGRAALRAVMVRTFALILMDVRMPTLDGYETATLIRQRRQSERTPIIFVTAFGRDEIETADAYASGAVDFVFAPVLPDVLRAKVSIFVDLFVQAQTVQRSLESITHLNAALRDNEARTQAVLDNVADGIFILDEHGLIESVNRSVGQLFGYRADEPVGQPFSFMLAPEVRNSFHGLDAPRRGRLNGAGAHNRGAETLGRREDGTTFAMEVERGEMVHGDRLFTLAFVRDASERKIHMEALEHQGLHDSLTGLANRTLFGNHVSLALASASRANEPRALLVMDLNGFKHVNDTLGHDHGDALLKETAARLVDALRVGDTVARLGGDEFAILPDGPCDLVAAAELAWKIERACEPDFVIDDHRISLSASVGIALYPEHGTNAGDLLRRADLAMYEAKRSESAHAVFERAQENRLAHHLAFLGDLRQCVARQELVLHYQPKIDVATRQISGVEALVRWNHPTQGLLAPGGFMPEVERTALIEPVTRWVLDEALRQQRAWRDEGLDLTMAVNIAGRSLRNTGELIQSVAELAAAHETDLDRLTLELTERDLIESDAPEMLERLHKMGAKVSIDDYGTGYSSLAYLQRLPIDEIKLDRSFITNLVPGGPDEFIVVSTINLAHNLGLTVVAEGVEDERVLEMLVAYACDSSQGYFFARPLPAEDLAVWLAHSPYAPPALAMAAGAIRGQG
jgi:diguanylate cyclase (GGDEF)-like protein/PAS domain S-box-containing protein